MDTSTKETERKKIVPYIVGKTESDGDTIINWSLIKIIQELKCVLNTVSYFQTINRTKWVPDNTFQVLLFSI